MVAKNHIVSFFGVFLLLLLLVIGGEAAGGAISPFCSKAKPGDQQKLCNAVVDGAPTWNSALGNVLKAAKKEAPPLAQSVNAIIGWIDFDDHIKNVFRNVCVQPHGLFQFHNAITRVLRILKNGKDYEDIPAYLEGGFHNPMLLCISQFADWAFIIPNEVWEYNDTSSKYYSLSSAVFRSRTKNI